ncbi:MAG: DUF3987 domain-containing protein, partial [Gemmatimonadales bacterium]|nr:DUF3987 domain-containing protein [Gemmatimonadales bacterium]
GYGVCAYTYLNRAAAGDIAAWQASHKAWVERINATAGYRLVDPQVSDAGTRFTRIPGCLNTKGATPRTTRTLSRTPGTIWQRHVDPVAAPRPERRINGDTRLTGEQRGAIAGSLVGAWSEGNRHAVALGVAGLLAKAGVREEEAKAIVEHAAVLADDDEPGDRATAVRTSYERVRSGLPARGFMSLRELIPAETLAFIDATLQSLRGATVPGPNLPVIAYGHDGTPVFGADDPATGARVDPDPATRYDPPPEACFRGWFAEYRALMAPTTEAPDAFHLGCSLALVGMLLGRRVWTYNAGRHFPNLYVVLVGPTGRSRKDTAMDSAFVKMVGSIPRHSPITGQVYPEPFTIETGFGSGEGLLERIAAKPRLLMQLSEFSSLVLKARREAGTLLIPNVISLWQCPNRMTNITRGTETVALDPFLSIVAGTTPDTLAADMGDADLASGFANRFLLFGGNGCGPKADPPRAEPSECIRLMVSIMDTVQGAYPHPIELPRAAAAQGRWQEWYDAEYVATREDDAEARLAERLASNIQRIALIYAASEGCSEIGTAHLDAAIALGEWQWAFARKEVKRWGQELEARVESNVRLILERAPMHQAALRDRIGRAVPISMFNKVVAELEKALILGRTAEGYLLVRDWRPAA